MMSKVKLRIQSKIKNKKNNNKQQKTTVLKNASLLYYEMINIYKKEYEQVFESRGENWKKKHDY